MYYCYISHDKVSQLLSQYEEHDIEELIEKRENKQEKKGAIGIARIFQLISLDASYGRSDLYHKEKKLRENITQKLLRLLNLISSEIQGFNINEEPRQSSLYYYAGSFKVKNIDKDQNMVTIESSGTDYSINLHCSLKYFSSNTDFNMPIQINSSNYAFLKGSREVVFETVFFNIGRDDDGRIWGTPVFLLLSDLRGNL